MSVIGSTPLPSEAFIFIVDGALLETQSMLLAASLARAHAGAPQVKTYAYLSARSADLPDVVRAVFEASGVETRPLPESGALWAKPYLHGNKILACAQTRDVTRTTFLDTDTLVIEPLLGLAGPEDNRVMMVPEGLPTWGKDGEWPRAYDHVGLTVPDDRVTLVRGRELLYPPYFNAGFISFPETPLPITGTRFASEWLALASDFDHRCPVRNKRPWLDQITLPLTLYKHGVPWLALPDIYNYSLAKRAKVRRREQRVKVMHYHSVKYLAERPVYAETLLALRQMLPTRLHAQLDQHLVMPELMAEPAL